MTEVAAVGQQESLDLHDLALPIEIQLPEWTRHEVTKAPSRNRGSAAEQRRVYQTHLRVFPSDFDSTSLEAFNSGVVAAIERALFGGSGGINPRYPAYRRRTTYSNIYGIGAIFAAVMIATPVYIITLDLLLATWVICAGLALTLICGCCGHCGGRSVEAISLEAALRNCQLVINGEAACDSDGGSVMPAAPVDFKFRVEGLNDEIATLFLVSWTELATIRLIQLMKFADRRAHTYLKTLPGQALLEELLPTATDVVAIPIQ